jgi:catechol 2,3-dioxygenase-like lactoylglutathione lyase family enzyme
MKVNHAFSGFSVDDQEKAKDFYTRVLGFEVTDDQMGLNLKLPSGGEVFIYGKANHEPATFTIFNLVVDDIDQAVEELESKGVSFEHYDNIPEIPVPQDEKGVLRGKAAGQGPDIAWFKDPAGNILSVIQN